MLEFMLYDTQSDLELTASFWDGQLVDTQRPSYRDARWPDDPYRRTVGVDRYSDPPKQASYIDIQWQKRVILPAREDAYTLLEKRMFALQTLNYDWTNFVLRVENESAPKRSIWFYNIAEESPHPRLEDASYGIEEAPNGYPSFTHEKVTVLPDSSEMVYEQVDFQIKLKSTRKVFIDCELYEKAHGSIPRKLPVEFLAHMQE